MISRNSSIPCGVYDVRQTHILVEHRPRIRRLFSNLGIPFMSEAGRGEAIIRVDFSGVAIANTRFIETEKFLEKVVLDKAISCRLLSRNGQGGIDCLVFRRKVRTSYGLCSSLPSVFLSVYLLIHIFDT